MSKRIKCVVGIMSGLWLGVTVAEAGERREVPVTVAWNVTAWEAKGMVASARASASTREGIGCAVTATETVSEVLCFARSADTSGATGGDFMCTSTAARIVQAATGIGPMSYITMRADKWAGRCLSLTVENHSRNRPMVP
jgi:hypothetical protein